VIVENPLSRISERRNVSEILKVLLIVSFILVISLAHYFTGTHLHQYHDIYRRLYYLPIFIAALWFGLKGGLGASLLSSVLYAPHVLFQWKIVPSMELEKYLEILLFNIVGALTGILAERANRQRDLYRKTAEKLEGAYEDLQKSSTELLLLEKKLRQNEKISALGELSATVAHEFMNPLGSIKGTVEILRDDFPEGHEKHAFLGILIKEIDRLDRTVRSVLRFGRQETLFKTRCSPCELMETILVLTAGETKQRNISVDAQLAGRKKSLELDADKIQQVFLNVVMNAVQAMPRGGRLTVRTEWTNAPAVEMGEEKGATGEGMLVTVEDTGPGIPAEELDRIFESFYTTREEGTGLGLSIVKTLVKAHEGSIHVLSTPGTGARFLIWLPDSERNE